MCDPITMTVLAVAGTAATLVTQSVAADAQNKAIGQQLQTSYNESAAATVAEENDHMRAARKEQARIKVAAGESGLQLGGSIEQLLLDSQMQTGQANARSLSNLETANNAARAQATSMYSQVEKPSLLGAGLQLASAGVSGYSQEQSLKISRPKISKQAATDIMSAGMRAPAVRL